MFNPCAEKFFADDVLSVQRHGSFIPVPAKMEA